MLDAGSGARPRDRHRVRRRSRSAHRPVGAVSEATRSCSRASSTCTTPAPGCSWNRRLPICRPICGGCSSRGPSRSSSWPRSTGRWAPPRPPICGAAVERAAIRSIAGLDDSVEAADRRGAAHACARPSPASRSAVRSPSSNRCSRGCGRRRASTGRCRSDRCGGGRTRSATSKSWPPRTIRQASSTTLTQLPDVARVLHRSERRLYLLLDRVQVGVRFPQPASAGAALLHLTGSVAARQRAAEHLARERRRVDADGRCRAATEEEIYDRARAAVHSAGDSKRRRRNRAAREGTLPTLVVARRHPRRSPHALDVERRPRLDRSDGRRRAARSATSTSPSPTTRRIRRRRAI